MADYAEKISTIRMCVLCRTREVQKKLTRFKVVQGEITAFDGNGRSLYLCSNCLAHEGLVARLSKLKNITQTRDQIQLRIEELRW